MIKLSERKYDRTLPMDYSHHDVLLSICETLQQVDLYTSLTFRQGSEASVLIWLLPGPNSCLLHVMATNKLKIKTNSNSAYHRSTESTTGFLKRLI